MPVAPLLLQGPDDAYVSRREVVIKYTSLFAFLGGTVGDAVLKKLGTYYAYYPAAQTQLTALVGLIVFPIVVLGFVLAGAVKKHQLVVPWVKPLVVAVGFALHNVLLNVGAGHKSVDPIEVVVLVKFVIPLSMLFNMPRITLGLRYSARHWCGMLILMLGIIITVLTPLAHAVTKPNVGSKFFNMVLIPLSAVPLAAAFTFMEKNLKGPHANLFTVALWMYVCFFQFGIGFVLLPISSLLSGLPLSDTWDNLGEGIMCLVFGQAPEDGRAPNCQVAAGLWWATAFFALTFNMAMPLCTKYSGATLMWLVRGMAVPLTSLFFASRLIMGVHAQKYGLEQVVGLVFVVGGMLLFNSRAPTRRS